MKVLSVEYVKKMAAKNKNCIYMEKYCKCRFTNKRCNCKSEFDFENQTFIMSCDKIEY